MRSAVAQARAIQIRRNGGKADSSIPNAHLSGKQLDSLAKLDDPSQEVLKQAMNNLGLSARAYDKVRRVARTIADLEASDSIQMSHVAEAVQYRLLDRKR
jgi:magnesium chelatase family protein